MSQGTGIGWGRATRAIAAVLAVVRPVPAHADTRAGTGIENVASLRWQVDGGTATASSNTSRFAVVERLDVTLAPAGAPVPSGDVVAWPVTLTNVGNGEEAFTLAATADGASVRIAVDSDGDGHFDPAHDQVIDGRSATLSPGAPQLVFVLLPAAAAATAPVVQAAAVTGSGAPGRVFAAAGDGGVDAVVGPTGASARLVLGAAPAGPPPMLVKTQSVQAPDGSDRPVSGAIVTYTLEAQFTGPAIAARIEDAVPAGTRLVPNTLQLDGTPLTDAADGDAGTADAAGITVALGDIPGPGVRRVRFQVQLP